MELFFPFVFITLYGFCYAGNIPDYIHICNRNDIHVAKCIRESIEILRPKLKDGIKELDVPGLEPLRIDEVVISRGDEGSNFKALLKNIDVTGASDFQVTKLKLDVGKNTYRIGVKFPTLDLTGDYDINARILVAPIKGTGKFYANVKGHDEMGEHPEAKLRNNEYSNVEGHGVLLAQVNEKEGHKQITFTNFDLALRFDDYNIHLDNLFNGDKVLSQAANEILNSNKAEFIPIAIPFIQRKASDILLDIANKITKNVDYDEIFPAK